MFKFILSSLLIFHSLFHFSLTAQPWPVEFNFQPGAYGWDVDEAYDHSYILTGKIVYGSVNKMGILTKTDVNGNVLWFRIIGNLYETAGLKCSYMTSDKGIISTGWTTKYDPDGDILILKNDACGNKVWCKIFSVPNDVDDGLSIIQLINNNYLVLVEDYGTDIVHERVWLFYLDSVGNTIWQKVYCQNDPKMINQIPFDIIETHSSNFLITGMTYYEDTLVQNLYWPEPLFVKVDTNGNEIWAKPWTQNTNEFIGYAAKSFEDNNGIFYCPGVRYHVNPGNFIAPSIMKSDSNGNPLYHFEIVNHPTSSGVAATLDKIADNELIISYRYTDPNNIDYIMALKTDTLGNLIKEKQLLLNEAAIINSTVTSNNKILMVAGHYFSGWKMYLYKFTFDLEYDSIDTHVYNYDSLCPNPTYADTIDLDCDVIINVEEPLTYPENGKIRIFPNPATDYVTLTLPDYYSSWSQVGTLEVQTTWYRYPEKLSLQIFDMLGRLVSCQVLESNQKEISLDISGFPSGMLLVRLLDGNRMLTSGKFIKE